MATSKQKEIQKLFKKAIKLSKGKSPAERKKIFAKVFNKWDCQSRAIKNTYYGLANIFRKSIGKQKARSSL